jgi:hypothetical protein
VPIDDLTVLRAALLDDWAYKNDEEARRDARNESHLVEPENPDDDELMYDRDDGLIFQ